MIKQLALLCLVASWLAPIHFLPWVSWHSEVLAFLGVLLLVFTTLCNRLRQKNFQRIEIPTFALIFVAIAMITAIQATCGLITFGGDALIVFFYMSLCFICASLGFASSRRTARGSEVQEIGQIAGANQDVSYLAMVVLAGAFLSTMIALAQVFDLWEGVDWISRMPAARRPGGNLGQPNQLASLILMGVASLLFLFESKKLSAASAWLILIVLAIGLAITESRTGLLSFYVLALWFFAKRITANLQLPIWFVVSTLFSFSLLFLIWPTLIESIQMLGVGATVNTQPGTRFIVWPQLIQAVMLRPWWGWGVGRVSDAQNAVAHDYSSGEAFTYSHNIFLDLAVGVGIPLAVLISLVAGGWLSRRIKCANELLPWYCVALALPVAIHSLLEFPFAYAYFLAPVIFALGVLDGTVGKRRFIHVGVAPLAGSLLLIAVLMIWSVVEYLEIEEDFRVVRFESLRLGTKPENYQRPTVVLLTQLDALLTGGRIVPRPGMKPQELELAKNVALRYPWTATQNRYALALALNGHTQEAIRQMRVIRALHGENTYREIQANWVLLGTDKYPQLAKIVLPN